MEQIKLSVDDIYINLFLIAISRKYNFAKLVKETDEETRDYAEKQKSRFLPEGYLGLYYTELLARKMGSSLGDAYNLSEDRKEEIIRKIVESFEPINEAYGSYYDNDDEGIIEFQGLASILDISDEKEILLYYADLFKPDIKTDHNIYTYYDVTFRKDYKIDGSITDVRYSIMLGGTQSFSSDYVYDKYEVWAGTEGFFADFIEKVISEYKETHVASEQNESGENDLNVESEGTTDDNKISDAGSVLEVENPVIESKEIQEGPTIIDELVTYIWDDTRTVDLLDKFEGYDSSDSTRYRRIVIKNTKYVRYSNRLHLGFNLVIERGHGSDYVGDVTFTEFKKGNDSGLSQHVSSEITDDIIEQYIDKDQFYRFSKPYLLRAQNSSNRTGYGWEWDWSGGYGDYTEGTLYGETTNYFFVGAYVTTGYSYEASSRKAFVENPQKTKTDKKITKIVFYDGKLSSITQNPTVQRYLKIETTKGSKYIPASYDATEDIYYLAGSSQKYKQIIENGDFEVKKSFGE